MKNNFYLLIGVVLLGLFLMPSCKKDELILNDAAVNENLEFREDMRTYDSFGKKLEKAIDAAFTNRVEFKYAAIKLTQERVTGDFEVLLSSFLDYTPEEGTHMKSILLENAKGLFEETELDAFLAEYPSMILATRGNIKSWIETDYTAPVAFVSSNFKETDKSLKATQNGEVVSVDLTRFFHNCVVALHISERHDRQGNLIITSKKTENNIQPSINKTNELRDGIRGSVNCAPEPTSCTDPSLTAFNVEVLNDAIRIEYSVDNFPASLCSWGRIIIRREGPDENGNPSFKYFYRFANDDNIFYDLDFIPFTEYIYTVVSVQTQYLDPQPSTPQAQEWVVCGSDYLGLTRRAESPASPRRLHTFIGENISNTKIRYTWEAPQDAFVAQYRLSKYNGSEFVPIAHLDAATFIYEHIHTPGERGEHVEMLIEYRGYDNTWKGAFFDRTYASYRNTNEPLKYYGLQLVNVEDWEQSTDAAPEDYTQEENLIFGSPEIRLVAVRGTSSGTDEIENTTIFTTACTRTETITKPHPIWWWITNVIEEEVPNSYYSPKDGPQDILLGWDRGLVGYHIRVKLEETDSPEISVAQVSEQETYNRSISANIGAKIPILGGGSNSGDSNGENTPGVTVGIGIESSHSTGTTIRYNFPNDDQPLDIVNIYYHYPRIHKEDGHLLGTIGEYEESGDPCNMLEVRLNN